MPGVISVGLPDGSVKELAEGTTAGRSIAQGAALLGIQQ